MESIRQDRLRKLTGRHNPLLKQVRLAFTRGELTDDGYCAIEGVRTIEEAIRSGLRFRGIFFSESGESRANRLLPQIAAQVEALVVPDKLFAQITATERPQGVAALVRVKKHDLNDLFATTAESASNPALVVIVAGLQDPGNLGTIVRSSEAFEATGIVTVEGTVSRFNSKVIRGSAGSMFRVPMVEEKLQTALPAMREHGLRVVATSSHKGTPLAKADLAQPVAILIGNEGAGLPRHTLNDLDELIAIPHSPRVESLNAGVAGSIILYEAARQRTKASEDR